jgi:hypothetical protein
MVRTNTLPKNAPVMRQLKMSECSGHNLVERKSEFSDPAFAGNKCLPVHRWVPWIAGFSSDFVKDVLARYLSRKGTVLDPFCGVGTTLVEAVLQQHDAIGFEINPYAALASRAKTTISEVSLHAFQEQLVRLKRFCAERLLSGYQPRSVPRSGTMLKS